MSLAVSERALIDVHGALKAISAARDIGALTRDAAPIFARFGYDSFSVFEARPPGGTATAERLLFGAPNEGWRAHYVGAKHFERDEVLQRLVREAEPFTWSAHVAECGLSDAQARMHNEARQFAIGDAYVAPMHLPDGSIMAILCGASSPSTPDPARADALFLLAYRFMQMGRRLLTSDARPSEKQKSPLSPRQRECLLWVRAGKTDWEIGKILNLSEHTVIEHLAEARRRLGVKSRAQAVIEAISRGIISL